MDDLAAVRRALDVGADVVMVDFEVPDVRRNDARAQLPAFVDTVPGAVIFVRVAPQSRRADQECDLSVAVRAGIAGVILPDAECPEDVVDLAERLDLAEKQAGIATGTIGIVPLPESASAIRRYYDILVASPRVWAAWFAGTAGGDLARDVRYCSSADGAELLYMRSKVVLDARAAGIGRILDIAWRDAADLDGFRRDTERSRGLGYTGRLTFTADQARIANEVYDR